MQVGMVGLGRMGANLVRRLMQDGHRCVGYARTESTVQRLANEGMVGATSLADLVARLDRPRVVWLMVPAAAVQSTLDQLIPLLDPDDVVIDGGNSYYRDDVARAGQLAAHEVHYVDCGTSGGVWGLERGYCLMIGGEQDVVARLDPIFKSIAPGRGSAEPTPSRTRDGSAPEGYLRCGPSGAGHFVKMVHNGVEYGMMSAIGEGLSIIKHANVGETPISLTPRPRRCVTRLPTSTTSTSPRSRRSGGEARSSDRGWWTSPLTRWPAHPSWRTSPGGCQTPVRAAGPSRPRSMSVPAPVITTALIERFESRGLGEFTDKVLSAMRSEFGGHAEKQGSRAGGPG